MESKLKLQIAYLVAAHTDFEHLYKLCSQLVLSGDVFVHIDNKVKNKKFTAVVKDFEKRTFPGDSEVVFLKKRISVYWAGFSQVKLQHLLLKTALDVKEKKYNRFVFLSGLCYPIKSYKYILDVFGSNMHKEYVNGINLTKYNDPAQKLRYAGYHLFRDLNFSNLYLKKVLVALSRNILWKLRITKPLTINSSGKKEDIYFGGSWIGLTRECAEYVCENLDESSRYCRYFKTSYACDELCIPTIVFNSKFCNDSCLINEKDYRDSPALFSAITPLHYLCYQSNIKVFNELDYDVLCKSDRLFARKLVSGKSDRLMEMLNDHFFQSYS